MDWLVFQTRCCLSFGTGSFLGWMVWPAVAFHVSQALSQRRLPAFRPRRVVDGAAGSLRCRRQRVVEICELSGAPGRAVEIWFTTKQLCVGNRTNYMFVVDNSSYQYIGELIIYALLIGYICDMAICWVYNPRINSLTNQLYCSESRGVCLQTCAGFAGIVGGSKGVCGWDAGIQH